MRISFNINNKNELNNHTEHEVKWTDSSKIIVLNNNRVLNLVKSGVLTYKNFEEEYYKYLDYGLVLIVSEEKTILYNDIWGAFPFFKIEKDEKIEIISNDFNSLTKSQVDEFAVIELIHFNHILGERTIDKKIKKIKGGQKISVLNEEIHSEELFNWEKIVQKLSLPTNETPAYYLKQALRDSLNEKEVTLTLTGGFDSRLLLSTLLSENNNFKTITWGLPGNLQTSTAQHLSKQFNLEHKEVQLDSEFTDKIEHYLNYVTQNGTELPFIIDIPQFIYMCEQLPKQENLVTGFMGSEIVRGPSYSSQVTLTKFAADIGLSKSKNEIKQHILAFNEEYPYINSDFITKNMDLIIDEYTEYAKINIPKEQPNYNIFKYLFQEKYAKIYGMIMNYHHQFDLNLINPYMDFKFISAMFKRNSAFTTMTPYENSSTKNFLLYRLYAKEIKNTFPPILKTKLDRGYYVNDLISLQGMAKLIPYQVYRKFKKKKGKTIKVVDAYTWYKSFIHDKISSPAKNLSHILNYSYIHKNLSEDNKINDLQKIKLQLILGLTEKLNGSKN